MAGERSSSTNCFYENEGTGREKRKRKNYTRGENNCGIPVEFGTQEAQTMMIPLTVPSTCNIMYVHVHIMYVTSPREKLSMLFFLLRQESRRNGKRNRELKKRKKRGKNKKSMTKR